MSDPKMCQELELLGRRHGDFSNDLRNLLHLLKPTPEHAAQSDNARKDSGKTSVGAADVRQLLAVCYAGEQALAEAYAEALHRRVLPVEIEPLVESQWRAIEFARDRIRRLTAERQFEPEQDSLVHHT